jgi:hypothetical protein
MSSPFDEDLHSVASVAAEMKLSSDPEDPVSVVPATSISLADDNDSCDSDSSSSFSSGAVHPAQKSQMMHAIIEEQNREIFFLRQNVEMHINQRKTLLHAVAKFIDNQTFSSCNHGLGDLFLVFCDVHQPFTQAAGAAGAATPA